MSKYFNTPDTIYYSQIRHKLPKVTSTREDSKISITHEIISKRTTKNLEEVNGGRLFIQWRVLHLTEKTNNKSNNRT